ncbi:cyclic beta-1,2-glucan synthetase [Bartonella doshiae]|uniref:Cellobiose phosphorylase n=2 Tax=Bartonella doshiae TaxID=33044 RepID=A0A380ZGU1_BARDO|nr:hypothetical protein MCS_00955 [Bartonella doshiae NCTC 12862 = ATCC 700133]MBB6158609.1 cyclic beta-1,2-glucan synthetase [Bartonella doshiae]SUV46183.1 Cellobiose phosphorylase [Bartonella doshiae]
MRESYRHYTHDTDEHQHIFTLQHDQINDQSLKTLLASARIILDAQNGSLSEQLKRLDESDFHLAINSHQESHYQLNYKKCNEGRQVTTQTKQSLFASIGLISHQKDSILPVDKKDLQYWNGYGGFNQHNYYVSRLHGHTTTPHPWINVIANHNFGFHVSAKGALFTWANNSRDYQLTPWSNDPISNRPGEALYLVDRLSLKRFSPVSAVECDENVIYDSLPWFLILNL